MATHNSSVKRIRQTAARTGQDIDNQTVVAIFCGTKHQSFRLDLHKRRLYIIRSETKTGAPQSGLLTQNPSKNTDFSKKDAKSFGVWKKSPTFALAIQPARTEQPLKAVPSSIG